MKHTVILTKERVQDDMDNGGLRWWEAHVQLHGDTTFVGYVNVGATLVGLQFSGAERPGAKTSAVMSIYGDRPAPEHPEAP